LPEGPEIRRAADRLARAVEGEIAERVGFHGPMRPVRVPLNFTLAAERGDTRMTGRTVAPR
jgi:formamidopyrimidine-DNA glycosylase